MELYKKEITNDLEDLLSYAEDKKLIGHIDRSYYMNLLLDAFQMDHPVYDDTDVKEECHKEITDILDSLCDDAVKAGHIEDFRYTREMFSTRLIGLLTPSPEMIRNRFEELRTNCGPEAATDYLYGLCKSIDYIKVRAIKKNLHFFAPSECGTLEITVNLSKPEKDPREIAKLKTIKSSGYPKCMLCIENPGYAGRPDFPARQNHRIVPVMLDNETWYLQYSPYAYYNEHCIVLNSKHVPMCVSENSFRRLFDFVDQFPHYLIGSNADLPVVGGSILNHDHFQGGRYSFPMEKAGYSIILQSGVRDISACVLDWPMTAVRLKSHDRSALIETAMRILNSWRTWNAPELEILSESPNGEKHNTITPILRKTGEDYLLYLVLRNNRTSEQHPLGIFHPHAELHHVKKENIGLIEVMGLFILPGRLKNEFEGICDCLTGKRTETSISDGDPLMKHRDWISKMLDKHGVVSSHSQAMHIIVAETAEICTQVLNDAGVFKQNAEGKAGLLRFLASVGMRQDHV